jgi:peptidoglycan/LPS O-acetylase OafA/YrhL
MVFAVVCTVTKQYFVSIAGVISITAATIVSHWSPEYMNTTYDFGFFRCLYGFFVGTLVQHLFRASKLKLTIMRGGIATFFEVLIVVTVGIFVYFGNQGILSLFAPLLFAITVYLFAYEGGVISYLLSASPFLHLGKCSYSIYMVHAVLAIFLIRIVDIVENITKIPMYTRLTGIDTKVISYGGEFAMDALAAIFLGTVVASASITYKYIEEPARQLFNRYRSDPSKLASFMKVS